MNVRVTHKVQRVPVSKPEVPMASQSFIDWFWPIDKNYARRFSRLSAEIQQRILIGIRTYIRMFEKNSMSVDPSPIREIIADAEHGLFYFEQVAAERLSSIRTEDRSYAAHYEAMEMAAIDGI